MFHSVYGAIILRQTLFVNKKFCSYCQIIGLFVFFILIICIFIFMIRFYLLCVIVFSHFPQSTARTFSVQPAKQKHDQGCRDHPFSLSFPPSCVHSHEPGVPACFCCPFFCFTMPQITLYINITNKFIKFPTDFSDIFCIFSLDLYPIRVYNRYIPHQGIYHTNRQLHLSFQDIQNAYTDT